MSELPRLNGVIASLEQGKTAFLTFSWLMPGPVRSYAALEQGRRLAGRG